jgi:two-component system chemotaxis sensor kinase CheA
MAGLTMQQIGELFAQESQVRLAELGRALLQLEENREDEALVRSIFRELHTLKGSAAVAGLVEVSTIAHRLEQLIDDVRSARRPVTTEIIDTLLAGADELGDAISPPQVGDSGHSPTPASDAAPVSRAQAPAIGEAPSQSGHQGMPATHQPSSKPVSHIATIDAPRPARMDAATILVPVERLEELIRLVGETASAHLRIGAMLQHRFELDPRTCTEFNDLNRSISVLQERVMRTQLVPVSTVTAKLHRAVRDLALRQGKDIRWETRGTDTEMDRSVLAQLADSLLHLVRNAVDHGIEPPDERVAAGKPRQAVLRLHAMQLGSEVIIAVTDDGRGVDVSGISTEARRRGIDTEAMTNDELLRLAFTAGLTTTRFVTDVSGRGVGLDVVRTNVESVHGRVELRSERGAGAEFRIIVPITVAVMRCLIVEAGGQQLALPFHRVMLSQAHDPAKLAQAQGRPVVWVDDRAVPVNDLAETLGLAAAEGAPSTVVVLADTSNRHAFTVSRLIGQRDVVIKALNPVLPSVPAVAGASVEPDGSILLVLDPPGLIHRARQISRTVGPTTSSPGGAPIEQRSILVVDDALTVRELQRSILERAGFDVRVAADGVQAMATLAEGPSDLVLTDIEMPNMDGFALTEAIRAHPTLTNIPVLILSSRSSDTDRQRGLDVGADGYIIKSGFDEASLLSAVNRLLGTTA